MRLIDDITAALEGDRERAINCIRIVASWLKQDLGTDWCATGDHLHNKLLDQLKEPKP